MNINKEHQAWSELRTGVQAALETYSNVHRGSGQYSMVTTHLYEQARGIVLDDLGMDRKNHEVIFCTPRREGILKALLKPGTYRSLSCLDVGLPLGVRALAVKRKVLPRGIPFETGGGTARLVSPGWVIWARTPDRLEAGTPAIINIIAFARALQLARQYGKDTFRKAEPQILTARDILYHDEVDGLTGQRLLDELRRTLMGNGTPVPTLEGPRPFINMDNGASTPSFLPVWNAVFRTWQQPDEVRRAMVHEVRSVCAHALGAPLSDYDVIFTSNTTEAINLAAGSFGRETGHADEPVVLNTILEHNSNELPWRMIPGVSLLHLKADEEGFIDINELEGLLKDYNQQGRHGMKRIRLVAVTGASNVTGVFNNIAEISRIVHCHDARLLVDAAQWAGHRRIEMDKLGIEYLAFSAHKMYAPFGSGALIARKGLIRFNDAETEIMQSSGEENAGGIAALGKAFILLQQVGMDLIRDEEQTLTARALKGMSQIEGLKLYGMASPDSPRFPQKGGVIVFSLGNILPVKVARAMAEQGGIGVRFGCHCAHMLVKKLVHVPWFLEQFQGLLLILFPRLNLPGIIRISLGIANSEEEVDTLIRVLADFARNPNRLQQDNQQIINDFVRDVARRVYK